AGRYPAPMRRTAASLLLAIACAGPASPPPEDPPLVFVRQRGPWTAEDLQRDEAECGDASRAALKDEPDRPAGSEAARAELRERTVGCMDGRGWLLSAPQGETSERWVE